MTEADRYYMGVKVFCIVLVSLMFAAFLGVAIHLMLRLNEYMGTLTTQVARLVEPGIKAEAAISAAGITFSQIAAKERNAFDAQQAYYAALGDRTNTLLDEVNHEILPHIDETIRGSSALVADAADDLGAVHAALGGLSDSGNSALSMVASDATALRPAIDNLSAITDHGVAISTNLEGLTADAHAESTLIVGRTQKAFAPQNRALALARMLGGGSLSLAELFYYISRGSL